MLNEFLITTGLPCQPEGLSVSAGQLADLCRHFLVFATDLSFVRDRTHLDNLREYVYRGGFLYVEVCHDAQVTPSMKRFHDRQMAMFGQLFFGTRSALLSPAHPIFNAPYQQTERPAKLGADPKDVRMYGAAAAFYGIYDDDRMIALLGQKGLRCAWGWQGHDTKGKMQHVANAYLFAYKSAG